MLKTAQFLFYPFIVAAAWGMFFALRPLFAAADLFNLVALVSFSSIAVVHVLERHFPYRRSWMKSHGDRVSNLLQTNLLLPTISRAAEFCLGWLALHMLAPTQFLSHLWPHQWNLLAQVVLALVICEFFFYWVHRLSHRTAFLWSFHRAHHVVPRVYWENAGRFHPMDLFLNWFFYFLPLIFFGVSPEVSALFLLTTGVTGILEHANVNYRGGILNYVFNTADLHRWHHSVIIEESSKNFGKVLCIWDHVFGTFFLPKGREVEQAGVIDDLAHLTSYGAELMHPIKTYFRPRIFKIFLGAIFMGLFGQGPDSLASGSSLATGAIHIPKYIPGTCIVDEKDPFEPHIRIESGEYRGLCVNPTLRRSAEFVRQQNGIVTIANFSHLDQFWLAEIPFDKIKGLVFQTEYFPMMMGIDIAHTQFRVLLEENALIKLRPQSGSQLPEQEITLRGFIFSVENISPFGERFDAVKGLSNQYKTAFRFISLEQKYDWMVRQQKHKVTQHVMTFSPQQAQLILSEALLRATELGIGKAYHTLYYNCVTELFDIVDKALGIRSRAKPFYPNSAAEKFKQRGFIKSTKHFTLFSDEIIGSATAPN